MPTTETLKRHQISVPLTNPENERLNRFLIRKGLIKGVFVRKAIINELEHAEQGAVRE